MTDTLTNGDRRQAIVDAYEESGRTATHPVLADRFGVSTKTVGRALAAAKGGQVKSGVTTSSAPTLHDTAASTGKALFAVPRGGGVTRRGKATRRRVMIGIASTACAIVAAVTFWISYNHIRHLAQLHGHADLAGWLPLGVDGLVIACAASLVLESHWRKNPVAWAGVVVGLVGTVTANVLAVPNDPIAQVMAGFMPIALAVSVHIVLRMIGR